MEWNSIRRTNRLINGLNWLKTEQTEQTAKRLDPGIRNTALKYENQHTTLSKRRLTTNEFPTEQDDEDNDVRTDGGTLDRKGGHDSKWRSTADPDKGVEITFDYCPESGDHCDESVGVGLRIIGKISDPQSTELTGYNHHY